MKTKLTEVIERAAVEAAELAVRQMPPADVAGARLDGWQDEAIEACVAFGLDYPGGVEMSNKGPRALVADLCDAFVDAFGDRAEQIARERGIAAEPSGAPTVQAATSEEIAMGLSREVAGRHVVPVDNTPIAPEQLEVECTRCGDVIAVSEPIGAGFICDDCTAEAAGIAADDVPHLKALASPTSSACKLQPWCCLQVGHAGACSASFMADGTVIS